MSSLAETIALLTNPTPKILDPEDDVNIETVAKVNQSYGENEEAGYNISELRSKTAPLLEDIDPVYAGRKVSRKSLDGIFNHDENTFSKDTDTNQLLNESGDSFSEEEEEEDDDEDLSESDINKFKSFVQNQHNLSDPEDGEESEVESGDSDASTGIESSEDMVHKFSNIDVTSEIEKGTAVKAQQELWNKLCECRIKLQKLLLICNKLPQPDCWRILKKKGGKDISDYLNKGSISVKVLLNNCLDLQEEILKQDPETSNLENREDQGVSNVDDEEIPSDTDEEMDVSEEKETKHKTEKKSVKRKLKCEEYEEILAKRHKSLIPYRNSVIQKWDEKTKLSSGRITQKSFSAFESSAVKQIEQILQDENRLIKRTQLKRSLYRVLGKPEISEIQPEENPENNKKVSKQDMLLRDYDPEIFDDDDFYRQLLKDVIESKSLGINPAVLRKQMEIQNVRNKMKRKVDTKASKGRKIRYDVHPKLVSFMTPAETSTISDEARDNLLKCLFGRSNIKNS